MSKDYQEDASVEETTSEDPGAGEEEVVEEEAASEEETTDESEDTDSKDAEKLRKQLLDTKRALTAANMERAELKGRLEGSAKPEQAKDWMSELDADEVRTDPYQLVDAMKRFREEVVEVVRAGNQFWAEKLNERDPERLAMKDRIEALKEDPDYGKLNDDALLVIAKKQAAAERKTTVKRVSAPPGGGSNVSRQTNGNKGDVRKTALFKAMYPDYVEEKK